MYQELKDTDSFNSSSPKNSILHDEHIPAIPNNKIEIFHTVSADDSLFGLALKYDQRSIFFCINFYRIFVKKHPKHHEYQ